MASLKEKLARAEEVCTCSVCICVCVHVCSAVMLIAAVVMAN